MNRITKAHVLFQPNMFETSAACPWHFNFSHQAVKATAPRVMKMGEDLSFRRVGSIRRPTDELDGRARWPSVPPKAALTRHLTISLPRSLPPPENDEKKKGQETHENTLLDAVASQDRACQSRRYKSDTRKAQWCCDPNL